jgi:hypothetical protein
MRRIIIDIYEHTSQAEIDEIVETVKGQGIDCRVVDLDGVEGISELGAQAREKVWSASQEPLWDPARGGVTLSKAETNALWLSILKDSRSVVALKG